MFAKSTSARCLLLLSALARTQASKPTPTPSFVQDAEPGAEFTIKIYNETEYPLFLDSSSVDPRVRQNDAYEKVIRYGTQQGRGPAVYDASYGKPARYGAGDITAPSAWTDDKSGLRNRQGMRIERSTAGAPSLVVPVRSSCYVAAYPLPAYPTGDYWGFAIALRFFARDTQSTGERELFKPTTWKSDAWWQDGNWQDETGRMEKYSWSVGVKGAMPWSGQLWSWTHHHYSSIWSGLGNSAMGHEDAYYNMKRTYSTGCHQDEQHTAEGSQCYWEDWKTLIIRLRMPK